MTKRPTVVIIGAGFGGLYAAHTLRSAPVKVLIIDQHNYHTFQPLLYQVATSALEPDGVARTVRGIFQSQRNVHFRQGIVNGVDWQGQHVTLQGGARIPFDHLIIAAGAVYTDFGVPGVTRFGFFLKTLSDAVNLRSHILRQFEQADADPSRIEQGALNFVIVGGGPTGVEMAGAMSELFQRVLPKDFPRLAVSRARIVLVEMQERLLPPYQPEASRYTQAVLRKRGVEVRLNTAVAEVREHEVLLKSGERIASDTLIWAAGVRGHPLGEQLGLELTRGARALVHPDLSLPGHPNAFVVGDLAAAADETGALYPQLAPVAMQQGSHAAKQILRHLEGLGSQRFRYVDRGNMAIVGRSAAVAELSDQLGGFRFQGFIAWLAWLFIHLIYLVGYRNRLNVLLDWAYSYITYDRHARLITDMLPAPPHARGPANRHRPPRTSPNPRT